MRRDFIIRESRGIDKQAVGLPANLPFAYAASRGIHGDVLLVGTVRPAWYYTTITEWF